MSDFLKRSLIFLLASVFLMSINVLASRKITGKVISKSIISDSNKATEKNAEPKALDYYSMIDNPRMGSTMNNPKLLNEIENLSNTIVRATFLGVVKQEELRGSDGIPFYTFTHSKIRVDEVYSGNVKPGDVLDFFEPYYIKTVNGEKLLTHHEQYYPCETGNEYMLFLEEKSGKEYDPGFGLSTEQNYYALAWCERGRYPILDTKSRSSKDITEMTNQELSLSPDGDATVYKSIYNEVFDKYMKN